MPRSDVQKNCILPCQPSNFSKEKAAPDLAGNSQKVCQQAASLSKKRSNESSGPCPKIQDQYLQYKNRLQMQQEQLLNQLNSDYKMVKQSIQTTRNTSQDSNLPDPALILTNRPLLN